MGKDIVRFSRNLPVLGVLAGVAIAVGVPYVALAYGPQLSGVVHTIVIILSLLLGGAAALVAVFFGTVVPREVSAEEDTHAHPQSSPPLEAGEQSEESGGLQG